MADKLLTGILVIVISSLILAAIFGLLSFPKPIRVVQNQGEVCPIYLNFDYQNEESFEIKLKNDGSSGGSMFVTLETQNISFKTKDRDIFEKKKTLWWNVPQGKTQNFKFEMQKEELGENFSIKVNYGCRGLTCIFYSLQPFCCNYGGDGNTYNLVNESIACSI